MKLLLAPKDDRLWVLGVGHVTAIDCRGDSVVADTIARLGSIDDAVACPEDRRIFAGGGGRPLWIIDMDNPAHVETLPSIGNVGMRFCDIPSQHQVYWCANPEYGFYSMFRTIDSRSNVILDSFRVEQRISGMYLGSTGNHVYCAASVDSAVLVIDARTDSVVATVRIPTWPSAREPLNPNQRISRIYVSQHGSDYGNGIPVIRDSMPIGLAESKPAGPSCRVARTMISRGSPMYVTKSTGLYDASGTKVAAAPARHESPELLTTRRLFLPGGNWGPYNEGYCRQMNSTRGVRYTREARMG